MEKDRLAAELRFVKQLASEAAQVALGVRSRSSPQEKANQSYVTDLDHDLERLIRQRLGERVPRRPADGRGVRRGGGQGGRRHAAVVDRPDRRHGEPGPRLPLWAISIGLIEAGEPVLGVIAIPPLGEMFWAVKGGGAWRDGNPLRRPDADDVSHPGQRLRRHQRDAGPRPPHAPGPAPRPGQRLLRAVVRRRGPARGLHLPGRGGPRRRRRRGDRRRGGLPLRHDRRPGPHRRPARRADARRRAHLRRPPPPARIPHEVGPDARDADRRTL